MYSLIKKYEGFKGNAYLCPAGVPTIGYGSTYYANYVKVKLGDWITEKDASTLLKWYCENEIQLPKGEFTFEQKQALCSLIYNIGLNAFNKSKLKRAIEKKDWKTAYNEWNFVYAKGKILPGLVKRRQEEKDLFFHNLGVNE